MQVNSFKLYVDLNVTINYSAKTKQTNQRFTKEEINQNLSFENLSKASGLEVDVGDKTGTRVNGVLGEALFQWMNSCKASEAQKMDNVTSRVIALIKDLQNKFPDSKLVFSGANAHYLDVKLLQAEGVVFKIKDPKLVYGPLPTDLVQQANLKALTKGICDIVKVAHQNNIVCWLDGETLLGASRNGAIIPYGKYQQVSFLQSDFDIVKAMLTSMVQDKPEKYVMIDSSLLDEKTSLRLKLKVFNSYVEIYFYSEDASTNQLKCEDPGDNTAAWFLPVDKDFIFPLRTIKFNDLYLPAPTKARDYLLWRFGDLRPTHHYDKLTGKYHETTGDHFVTEQNVLFENNLPMLKSSEMAVFEGPHANLPVGHKPKLESHQKWAEVIHQVHALFEKVGIVYWIDGGSLLGAYRYGEIIPWDCDCDIAVLQKHFNTILRLFAATDEQLQEEFGINRVDYPILNSAEFKLQDWSLNSKLNNFDISTNTIPK